MSKISVSIQTPIPGDEQDAKLVLALKNVTGLGAADIKERLAKGKDAYLLRGELYLNDHVDIASNIREVLLILRQYEVPAQILEILYDESWEDPIDLDLCQISEDILLNMLDNAYGDYS